ncbi:GAF domain-containing protein [Frondihabitans cladoniiphilus]|uniref:GAF domain-containing protein n=1 Tax=Frondihabitans cladoniiphilus TaxID=715785 RepID=A0ABP8VIE9_9MICO
MLDFLRRTFTRPLVALWLAGSRHSWKRRLLPRDSPHVLAPGTNPERVLIVGDGAASGRGVVTHDLGLPGFLARSLSARTDRATEVDILVDDAMTADECTEALASQDLRRYDIVLVSCGANEALALQSPREWQLAIRTLLTTARLKTSRDAKIFVLAAPQFGVNPHFPRALANAVDFHGGVLNTITERMTEEHQGVVYVPESRDQIFEEAGAVRYQAWAELIADRIVRNLDPHRPQAPSMADEYEQARQRAFEHLESLGTANDAIVDRLTDKARDRFGAKIAAVTFLHADTEHVRAVSGLEVDAVYPRSDAICDVAIRRRGPLVIEDARRDHRYTGFSVVAGELGIRFYAGFPIESPDGFRVGALCVMDDRSRRFSGSDAIALRDLAAEIQRHLYSREGVGVG